MESVKNAKNNKVFCHDCQKEIEIKEGGAGHFELRVKAEEFTGQSRVAQQRLRRLLRHADDAEIQIVRLLAAHFRGARLPAREAPE